MSTQTGTQKRRAVSPVFIGFVGMIIVPFCIVLATNSWDAPDAADFVRMAFGTVSASTVASVAAWWLAFNRMKAGRSDRYWFWGVAGIVTLSSIGSIFSVAETLQAQLTNLKSANPPFGRQRHSQPRPPAGRPDDEDNSAHRLIMTLSLVPPVGLGM